MPRPTVYGKRSRAIYDPAAAPSPEQTTRSTKAEKTKEIVTRTCQLVLEDKATQTSARPARAVLGEKSHNEVMLPVEAVKQVKSKSKKAKAAVEDDGTTEVKPQRRRRKSPAKRANDDGKETLVELNALQLKEGLAADLEPTPTELKDGRPQRTHTRFEDDGGETVELRDIGLPGKPSSSNQAPPNEYETHCQTLLDLSSHPLTDFDQWSDEVAQHFTVSKIAEASFGEVYRLSLRTDLLDLSKSDESVYKIIPLQAPESTLAVDKRKRAAALKKQADMTKPEDVTTEVNLLQRMREIPGFTNFRDVRILQGRPPAAFAEAFKTWNAEQKAKKKDQSHFPDPSKKSSYTDTQLWAVIEMQDAGNDLERLVENGDCTSIWSVWDIFWHVALTLAKGENFAQFEHRDLHLGNICVRGASSNTPVAEIDITKKLYFTRLETTIIDYTISRCNMLDSSVAYMDLSRDEALFQGVSTEEYQYDIYRYMRSALFFDAPMVDFYSQETPEDRSWEQYHPQTNLVWLHLVLYKLLEQIEWPSAKKAPSKKTKKKEHAGWKRACELENILLRAQDLLDPNEVCANGINSANDLVALVALAEGWLDVEDVDGHENADESALISQLEGLAL